MIDKKYDKFMTKCANIPYKDYSWLKDHCYKTLKRPCSPNTISEHLAILDLIKEHEERQSLDKIRAEIAAIVINGQVDEHTAFIRTGEQVQQMALDIIDKYKTESEG